MHHTALIIVPTKNDRVLKQCSLVSIFGLSLFPIFASFPPKEAERMKWAGPAGHSKLDPFVLIGPLSSYNHIRTGSLVSELLLFAFKAS